MRTLFVRSFQSVIAFAAVALLTGANDAGCGLGTVINGGSGGGVSTGSGTTPVDPPPPIACPSGMVAQLVCDPSAGSGGEVFPVDVCDGPNCPPPPPPCDPSDPDCVPPSPGDAGAPPPCDPSDPSCSSPPNPGNPPPPCDPSDPGCASPPQCDPGDANCPPPFPPPGCSFQCVPADQPCPQGMDAITVCTDSGPGAGEGGSGGSGGGMVPPGDPKTPVSNVTCWTQCTPHDCGSGGGETPSEPPIPD